MTAVEPVETYPANFTWKMERQLYMRYEFLFSTTNVIRHTSAHIAHLYTVYTSHLLVYLLYLKVFDNFVKICLNCFLREI